MDLRPKSYTKHLAQLEQCAKRRPRILCFGDSYFGRIEWSEPLCRTRVAAEEAGMQMFAVGGDRVAELEKRLRIRVLNEDEFPFPDVRHVFVLIGLNDLLRSDADTIVAGIARIMALLRARFPTVQLLTLPPAPIVQLTHERSARLDELNARLVSEFQAVSVWADIVPGQFESSDLTHLNPGGYKIFLANLLSLTHS